MTTLKARLERLEKATAPLAVSGGEVWLELSPEAGEAVADYWGSDLYDPAKCPDTLSIL